jgi:predicted nucleic acid-binding protein
MYLLDTMVISELRRPKPHGGVVEWLASVPNDRLHVCSVTFGEIQAGIEATREQDPAKAAQIEAFVDRIADGYGILPMDAVCFRAWARLMRHRSDAVAQDAMIAACAQIHGLTVATRNVKHFHDLGVPLVDPWTGAADS